MGLKADTAHDLAPQGNAHCFSFKTILGAHRPLTLQEGWQGLVSESHVSLLGVDPSCESP